jgi:hypothetical protein
MAPYQATRIASAGIAQMASVKLGLVGVEVVVSADPRRFAFQLGDPLGDGAEVGHQCIGRRGSRSGWIVATTVCSGGRPARR